MLTQTSETALEALVYLALEDPGEPVTPRRLSDVVGASPTYMAKVATLLAKADIVRTLRGKHGGMQLSRPPEDIRLLDVVEACQGRILGDYCQPHDNLGEVCAYHRAMHELHQAIVGVLRRWTVADLAAKPLPSESIRDRVQCKLGGLCATCAAEPKAAAGTPEPLP